VFDQEAHLSTAEAVVSSLVVPSSRVEALDALSAFRTEFYACLTGRADALFELADAVLCTEGPVTSLPELSLTYVHRRGHGAMYDALASGKITPLRFRAALVGLPLPRWGGRITLGVDITPWPRPDAECSPGRCHCHRPCRCDGVRQTIPGWPYSMIAALEPGPSSWTALLDAIRIGPEDEVTEVTAAQVRGVVDALVRAGQWHPGDPEILLVFDSGYDGTRLAFLLADLPVHLLVRIRCDRVFYGPGWPRADGGPGRPARHGHELKCATACTHPVPSAQAEVVTSRYGTAKITAWGRQHQRLTRRGPWVGHLGELPIVEGTLIVVHVDRLPGDRDPRPLWLWHFGPQAVGVDIVALFFAFLRRFDLEHTFRFFKQMLGWTRPRVRTPEQGELWTALVIAAHTQLRLARQLAADLRRPWERPVADPARLTPARVRRGFRRLRPKLALPASAPKPARPGPGRPKGRKSSPAPRHPVGKKRTEIGI